MSAWHRNNPELYESGVEHGDVLADQIDAARDAAKYARAAPESTPTPTGREDAGSTPAPSTTTEEAS